MSEAGETRGSPMMPSCLLSLRGSVAWLTAEVLGSQSG